MEIIPLECPDVRSDNIDRAKVQLAEKIVQAVVPLYDDIYQEQKRSVEEMRSLLEQKRNEVLSSKDQLKQTMGEYNRQKKLAVLLSQVEKMVKAGLTYDGTLRHEIIVVLRTCHKFSTEKIERLSADLRRELTKRFT